MRPRTSKGPPGIAWDPPKDPPGGPVLEMQYRSMFQNLFKAPMAPKEGPWGPWGAQGDTLGSPRDAQGVLVDPQRRHRDFLSEPRDAL